MKLLENMAKIINASLGPSDRGGPVVSWAVDEQDRLYLIREDWDLCIDVTGWVYYNCKEAFLEVLLKKLTGENLTQKHNSLFKALKDLLKDEKQGLVQDLVFAVNVCLGSDVVSWEKAAGSTYLILTKDNKIRSDVSQFLKVHKSPDVRLALQLADKVCADVFTDLQLDINTSYRLMAEIADVLAAPHELQWGRR